MVHAVIVDVVSSWNVMAHGDAREWNWRGNWRMECVASTLHTTSERVVSSITTADAHTSAASSRLNWRSRRFKWTRPFRRKTKSGFWACAITFQLVSTIKCYKKAVIDWPVLVALLERRISWQPCTAARAKCRGRSHRIRLWRRWRPRSRWLGTGSDAYDRLVGSAEYHKHCTNTQGTVSSKGLCRQYYLVPELHPKRTVKKKKQHTRVSETIYIPVLGCIPSDQTPYVIPPTLHLGTQTGSVSKRLGGRWGCLFLNTRRWTQFRNLVMLNEGLVCNRSHIEESFRN